MSNMSIEKDNSTKLLFFDNFINSKPQYNVEEIFFSKSVNIQQFRILKPDINPHAKYKSMTSVTQKDIIFNFEIFGRNLKKLDDKFELIFKCENINKTNGETDNIFPLLNEFTTNHIVFRGNFEKITMCIYGTTCDANENCHLVENARNDVSLEKLDEKIQSKKKTNNDKNAGNENNSSGFNEEQMLLEKYPIEILMNEEVKKSEVKKMQIETEDKGNEKEEKDDKEKTLSDEDEYIIYKFKEISHINKGNKNMIDKTKTGYIYYENDLKQIVENLLKFYANDDKNLSEQILVEHHTNYKNLFIILEILIERNKAHLEDDCVFNKANLEIFSSIPTDIISIINNSLKGSRYGETEMKYGLKLLKYLSNSEKFVREFILHEGMEQLYNIILNNTEYDPRASTHHHHHQTTNSSLSKKEMMPSSLLKALALENIYKLITFNCAYEKIIEKIDKKKFHYRDFMIKESLKEKMSCEEGTKGDNGDDEKEKDKDKEKEKSSKSKDSGSRHKRRSKSRHSRSSSSSCDSRYRSRSKSHNRDERDSSNYSRRQKKEKRENVSLDNGFQILCTLLISKKNILLSNILKNITKKINLIQYLKNLNDLIKDYLSSENKKASDLTKIQYHLQRLIILIQKLDTPYHLEEPENNKPNSFSDIDYPFKHYWIDYFDMNKKFFNKEVNTNENIQNTNILNKNINNLTTINNNNNNSLNNNNIINSNNLDEENSTEYIIRNNVNKYNSSYENIIITNEISELLEQYDFYNNILILLSCPEIQSTHAYYSLSIQLKNILALLCINIGGVNFLSKNWEKTSILLTLLEKLVNNYKIKFDDFCFRQIKIINFIDYDSYSKNEIIDDKLSELLIPAQKIENPDMINDLYIEINYLQIYYLLDYINKYIHLFDELSNLLVNIKKNNDVINFRQKTFNILFSIQKFYNKSELGSQAFLSLINNKYFIKIFIDYVEFISNSSEEIMEYEAHISLLMNIIYQILISTNSNTSIFLFQNKKILILLKKLQTNINAILDKKDFDTIDTKLLNNLKGLISLLKNLENSSINHLMTNLHDNIYNNILKYNLNEKVNTNDEKFKNYSEEYKLLVNKFNNDDIYYLGTLYKNGSFINEIYLSIKLLDANFKINPLLLIDGESKQLHSIIKYLVINSVNSLDYLLKKQMYKKEEGILDLGVINIIINEDNNNLISYNSSQLLNKSSNSLSEEYDNIITIANFLYYLFDILCSLLNNLLSSHVDHYRDEDMIDQLLLCINNCFNYLYMFYSLKETTYKIGPGLYKKINTVQNLFNKCLEVLHELCQFNTTIKLKFKDLIEKILSVPTNIPCQLYIINFILNNNNNEFTIDHFIDVFKQKCDKVTNGSNNSVNSLNLQNTSSSQNVNNAVTNTNYEETLMMEQIENYKSDPINLKLIISHCKPKICNFIDYIINMGISTNDDFIMHQCALIIINIFHKYTLVNNRETFEEIVLSIITEIKTQYEFLSKVKNFLIFEDKDFELYMPKIRNLLNGLKFLYVLVSTDVKFLFTFLDVAVVYVDIFKYSFNYISKKISAEVEEKKNGKNLKMKTNPKEEQLKNYMYDILLITLEAFKTLLNNKKHFEERYFFSNNTRYDLVEELPNVNQITDILKELNNFLLIFKLISDDIIDSNDEYNDNNNRLLFLINKTFEIFLNLSTNVYGQNLLLDNISLIEFVNELEKLKGKTLNKYMNIVICSLIKLTLVFFYDLSSYENKKQVDGGEPGKYKITQQRLMKLTRIFNKNSQLNQTATNQNQKKDDKDQNDSNNNSTDTSYNIHQLYELNNFLSEFLKNKNDKIFDLTLERLEGLQNILKDYKVTMDVLKIEVGVPTLPEMRRIQEKFEFIHVYNYFRQIQGMDNEMKIEINNNGEVKNINYKEILSNLNGNANSNMNYNQMPSSSNNEYNRNQINEFDKLLNWKKARIYSNEYDTLKIRDINFNIDTYLANNGDAYEFKFYQLKRNFFYISKDPFEHYCNSIEYNLHIINQFKNISMFIYNTIITKNYLFDNEEKYMSEILDLFFKENQNDLMNLEELYKIEKEININETNSSSRQFKKKIKSKINSFIYKQKYDKQQNNNMTQLRISMYNNMMKQDMQRYSSKVSGRNLSTHVDNVNPEKKVVSVTYNTFNNNSNINNANNANTQSNNINTNINNSQVNIGMNQSMITEEANPNSAETNKTNNTNFSLINSNTKSIISNNPINIGQKTEQRQIMDKNLLQPGQNIPNTVSSINNISNISNLNNVNVNPTNVSQNNIINIPNNNTISKNNRNINPLLLNNLKPNLSNDLQRANSSQSQQMLLMNNNLNNSGISLADRASPININNIQNMGTPLNNQINPTINPAINPTINPINLNNITTPTMNPIPTGVPSITPTNQPLLPPLQQPNNLINYIPMNQIQNPLINIPNISALNILSTQSYPNITPISPLNSNLTPGLNNQFPQQQFTQNMITIPQNQNNQQNILTKTNSGNLTNFQNQNQPQQQTSNTNVRNLMGTLQGLLQGMTGGGDPRKKKK